MRSRSSPPLSYLSTLSIGTQFLPPLPLLPPPISPPYPARSRTAIRHHPVFPLRFLFLRCGGSLWASIPPKSKKSSLFPSAFLMELLPSTCLWAIALPLSSQVVLPQLNLLSTPDFLVLGESVPSRLDSVMRPLLEALLISGPGFCGVWASKF